MASNEAAAEREERLKSALWYAIGQFVDDECINRNLNATPRFIGALTELVYTQIGTYASPQFSTHTVWGNTLTRFMFEANTSRDLETFSKHGGRRVINTDDVMLLTRRNEGLEEVLKKELDRLRAEEGRGADAQPKKRGRPSGAGVAKGKGKAKQ